MQRLLIINPNTTQAVTDLLCRHARALVGQGVQVDAVTARFGAPYISCEASYAVAAHATLDAWACARAQAKAKGTPAATGILIGCFGDPGLQALQGTSAAAVTGLAQAAFVQASVQGRFAIVTGGERWRPMLERLAYALGYTHLLAGIHTVTPTGAQLAQDPVGARALLAQACREAQQRYCAQSVIVGGAGLAGIAADIQPQVGALLIDSVSAGVQHALSAAMQAAPRGPDAVTFTWQGVSPELAATGA